MRLARGTTRTRWTRCCAPRRRRAAARGRAHDDPPRPDDPARARAVKRAQFRPLLAALAATLLGLSLAALTRALVNLARFQRGS